MDPVLFGIILGVCGFLGSGAILLIFAKLKELAEKDDENLRAMTAKNESLAKQINDLEKELRDRYPTKEDLRYMREEMREGFQRLYDLMNARHPKEQP